VDKPKQRAARDHHPLERVLAAPRFTVDDALSSLANGRIATMRQLPFAAALLCLAGAVAAQGPEPTLRDLESRSPRKLTKDEVSALMTGAKITRISARGSRNYWTNDKGGSFIASSDNSGAGADVRSQGRPSTAQGKWHLSDDGRYCILIEWRVVGNEEWCRYVLSTSDGYYWVRSDNLGTEKVYKFEIAK
jgi:Protein of unknown function (DUF995)